MKITSIDIIDVANDFSSATSKWRPTVVRVNTDEGISGFGEVGLAYGVGASGGIGVAKDLSALLIGMNPMDTEAIWEKMLRKTFWGQGGGPVVFAAISAIDIALMDIKGKVLNVPVYELLGGKVNDSIRCYASQLQFGWNEDVGPRGTAKEYADICKYAMEDGYDAVKLDFTLYDRDKKDIPNRDCEGFVSTDFYNMVEERIVAIREACGNVDIIMENHGRTDVTSGIKLGELCDKYNFYALEEPCTPLRPEFQKLIREKVRTPLASGERLYTRWQFLNYFKDNSIQLVQPDACNCGGISECRKICTMAEAFDVKAQIHCAGGPISTAAALQLTAATTNFAIYEHHFRSTQPAIARLGKYDYQPVNGKFYVSDRPGIGQELSEAAIAEALVHVTVDEP